MLLDPCYSVSVYSFHLQTVFVRSDGTETYYFNSQLFTKFMWVSSQIRCITLIEEFSERMFAGVMHVTVLSIMTLD